MMVDELDRILGSEERLEPSSGLAASTMEAVRRESRIPAPIGFPWRRMVPGLALCLALLAAGVLLLLRGAIPIASGPSQVEAEAVLRNPLVIAHIWTAASLLGTYLLVHLSFRLILRQT